MEENTTKTETRPDPMTFFTPGTIAERVDLQLGVLTQGVVDCMILASGTFPVLTEEEPPEPNVWQKPKAAGVSSWQAARSAELRDAARLSEATARLLTGFAKLRGQFSQDFTIRHTQKRNAKNPKNRERNTTIVHSYSLPTKNATSESSVDPTLTRDLTRGLARAAESMVSAKSAASAAQGDPFEELCRQLDLPPDGDDCGSAAGEVPKES